MQRNLRLTPLLLRVFPPTGFIACRRSRATGCAGRAARSAAQRQDRGAGESRRIVTNGISQTWLSACFLPRLCPAFALPGNSLDDIGHTGGDCLFYGPKPVRQIGCPEGLRAPGKPSLGMVFSEKRAGRPRIQAGPGEERGARSARKLIQWINFSEGGPVGPGSRSSRTFSLQLLVSHSHHGS